MKSTVLMILSICALQNAYASSLTFGARFDFSMRDVAHDFSNSVSDAFKNHPYLFGGVAVLGTAAIMCRVLQPKKEVSAERRSVSPDSASPFSDSEQTYVTPGFSRIVAHSQEGLTLLEQEVQGLEQKAKRMENIRTVRQVLQKESALLEGSYRAVLVKHKVSGENSVLLKSENLRLYRFPLILSDNNEGNLLCRLLNEYLDPSQKAVGEEKLRELIGLSDEQPWDEATLKSLLNGIRGTIDPLEQ